MQRMHTRLVEWPIDKIDPDPSQPRKFFDEAKLEELGDSIVKEGGVIQYPVVRPHPTKGSEWVMLIAGERRWLASKMRGLTTLTCVLRDGDVDPFELSLVENLNRVNLNPVEEGNSFKRLRDERGRTLQYMRELTGYSVPTISGRIRLVEELPKEILEMVASGTLPQIHALNLRKAKNIGLNRLIRMAHDLIEGRIPLELAEHALATNATRDKMREARLPTTGEGYLQRIMKDAGHFRSLCAVLQMFLQLPYERQVGAYEGVTAKSQEHLEGMIDLVIAQLIAFRSATRGYHTLASHKATNPADERRRLKKKQGLSAVAKILRKLLYDGISVRINLSCARLANLLHVADRTVVQRNGEKAFGILGQCWDRISTEGDPGAEEFIIFVQQLRKDFRSTPTFNDFINFAQDLDRSPDALDLSRLLRREREQVIESPEVALDSAERLTLH